MDEGTSESLDDWLDVDIPMPKTGARLLDSSKSRSHTACLNVSGVDRWDAYALGFKQLGDVGVESLGQRRGPNEAIVYADTIVYAIMYNYRHYLEVRIKGLIVTADHLLDTPRAGSPTGHNLEALWARLRPMLEQIWPNVPEYDTVEEQIQQFAAIDPGSDAFRYPLLRDGSPSLRGINGIDLLNVKEIIDGIDSLLDGSGTGIYELLQQKSEAYAAAADYAP